MSINLDPQKLLWTVAAKIAAYSQLQITIIVQGEPGLPSDLG